MNEYCPDHRLEPAEDEPCGACKVCGLDIYQGDNYYKMPNGDAVCENCVLDWASKYEQSA